MTRMVLNQLKKNHSLARKGERIAKRQSANYRVQNSEFLSELRKKLSQNDIKLLLAATKLYVKKGKFPTAETDFSRKDVNKIMSKFSVTDQDLVLRRLHILKIWQSSMIPETNMMRSFFRKERIEAFNKIQKIRGKKIYTGE